MPDSATLRRIRYLSSQPLANLVRQEIERQILSGELSAGDRLNELEIARKLGVSRAPVRESLRTLEQAGLVVSRKNYGVCVRVVSIEEVAEIYQARACIDAGVGMELARSIKAAQLSELQRMVEKMETACAADKTSAYHELNVVFHERMVEMTGNRKLLEIYRRLLGELSLYRSHSLGQPGAMQRSINEHRGFLESFRRGDSDAAGKAMRDHILASGERMQQACETVATGAPGRLQMGEVA
ncbi:MAG: FCD domain-containing protein [Burkholderiales bacterium]|nr:FCD domain-containing protein [Burkholderiales bacterium]